MKRKTGWNEWSDRRCSIFVGCDHDCRYCFAREMAIRFSSTKAQVEREYLTEADVRRLLVTTESWRTPRLNVKAAARKWGKMTGVIAFPGTHDITPATLAPCRLVMEDILRSGNKLLIVTKPHYEIVDALCMAFLPWRDQIEWRMTITARDPELLAYWEPGAPTYQERLAALRGAMGYSYKASASIEPMLDPEDIIGLVRQLEEHVTGLVDSIWIGKLNHLRRRVRVQSEEDERQVERIERLQADACILEIVERLKHDPLIRFKDSIQDVIARSQTRKD